MPAGNIPAENAVGDDLDNLHVAQPNQLPRHDNAAVNPETPTHAPRPRPDLHDLSIPDLVNNIERIYSPSKSFPSRFGNAMASLEVPNLFLVRSTEDIVVRMEARSNSNIVRTIRKVGCYSRSISICLADYITALEIEFHYLHQGCQDWSWRGEWKLVLGLRGLDV
jgi:hypothetical protein